MSGLRLLLGMTILAATLGIMTAAPVPRTGLVVHEWGTFTSFSGSDGAPQKFFPNAEDLPRFVYSTTRFTKIEKAVAVSLETPVLYFYADRPITATARATFPAGKMTEWFPQGQLSADAKTLTWPELHLSNRDESPLPIAPGPNRYYAARAVNASRIEAVSRTSEKEVHEREKFLFYRGAGDPTTPLSVSAQGSGQFTLKVAGDAPITGGLLLEVKAGQIRFRPVDPIPANASVNLSLPSSVGDAESVRAALTSMLTHAGLFEVEARAMVKSWDSSWLGEDGTRVLYILPSAWTDRTLPLTVTPAPDTLVRVMVGRHDVLTPERETEVDGLVRRIKGPAGPDQSAAHADLYKLGRFAAPAAEQAEWRLAERR
jgi:hypothetical protein